MLRLAANHFSLYSIPTMAHLQLHWIPIPFTIGCCSCQSASFLPTACQFLKIASSIAFARARSIFSLPPQAAAVVGCLWSLNGEARWCGGGGSTSSHSLTGCCCLLACQFIHAEMDWMELRKRGRGMGKN